MSIGSKAKISFVTHLGVLVKGQPQGVGSMCRPDIIRRQASVKMFKDMDSKDLDRYLVSIEACVWCKRKYIRILSRRVDRVVM